MTQEDGQKFVGQWSRERSGRQEELKKKCSLSSEESNKLTLAWGFPLRTTENQMERKNGFKMTEILVQA